MENVLQFENTIRYAVAVHGFHIDLRFMTCESNTATELLFSKVHMLSQKKSQILGGKNKGHKEVTGKRGRTLFSRLKKGRVHWHFKQKGPRHLLKNVKL